MRNKQKKLKTLKKDLNKSNKMKMRVINNKELIIKWMRRMKKEINRVIKMKINDFLFKQYFVLYFKN